MEIINKTISALKQINVPRYYTNERGFVAAFNHHLQNELDNSKLYPSEAIPEAEVQKGCNDHCGVTQRPGLLIHIPIETGLTNRSDENNFVGYAFKRIGYPKRVREDFDKLDIMFDKLNYGVGIFINIGAYPRRYLEIYQSNFKDRIHEISTALVDDKVYVMHSCFKRSKLYTQKF